MAISLAQDNGADNFDGNPDWAPDGRPLCPDDVNVTAVRDNPVLIGMDCQDTGPDYERTSVREAPTSDPANGSLGPFTVGDPSTVTYTPNPGFTGTDSFQFNSFDDYGFGTDMGTVTITVVAPAGGGGGGGPGGLLPTCGGRPATIVGTAGNDTLFGLVGNDVIVTLGGNDTVRSGSGNDIVCTGAGTDRVIGGAGSDRLNGEAGRDRLSGGSGNDRLGGGAGRDRLNGGGSRDTCAGGPARDRASACERVSGI